MEKDLDIDSLRIWNSMKQAELARNKNAPLPPPSLASEERGRVEGTHC